MANLPRSADRATDVRLLVNPEAGRGGGLRHADSMHRILERSGRRIHCGISAAPGHLAELVRDGIEAGCRDFVIAGGDGSFHEAAGAVLASGTEAALGIVPVGRGNDFVKSLGTPRHWRNACEELAIALSGHGRRRVDAGRCNDEFFVNSVGIGLDARVTQASTALRWLPGVLAYPAALATVLVAGTDQTRVHITTPDGTLTQEASMIIACNGAWFGGLFHIAPPARIDDGRLCIVVAAPLTRRRLLRLVPRVVKGTHVDAPEATILSAQAVRIETEAPMPLETDGETPEQPVSALDIRCLPGALQLIG